MKRTESVVCDWSERWRTPMIRVLVTAMVVVLAPSSAADAAGASPAPLRVSVDPQVELFSVIYDLAGNPEQSPGRVLSYYETKIDRHFGPHRDHPVVALVAHLKETRERSLAKWFDYGVQVSLAVHVTDAARLELRVPLDPWPETLHRRWTPELIDEFLAKARDFARQTDFTAFLENQRAFYSETVSRAERALRDGIDLKWFDRFFGPSPNSEFFVFMSPLGGPNNFAFWIRGKDGFEAISVTGVWQSQWLLPWTGGVPVVVHELIHSYVNPAAEPYRKELTEAVDRMKTSLIGNFGRTIRGEETAGFVNESLARAAVIRYLDSKWGPLAARRQLGKEMKNGLFWMPELLSVLENYEQQRHLYPSFQAYMPAIVEFFQGYSMKIESKAALARVANAMLPVYVALLAAYGLAGWVSSRRGTAAKIKTRWDWLFKASVALTIMVSLAEFVVLGNRPGFISMVTGGVLFVSALFIAVKSHSRSCRAAIQGPEGRGASLRSELCRQIRDPVQLACLFVVIGAPLLMSARLAWGLSALAALAALLQTRAKDKALIDFGEDYRDRAT